MTTRLVGLKAESFKRLELVELHFPEGGGTFSLMGENEAGKSSTLDALDSIIAGRRGEGLKSKAPIHDGADTARVIATFDDIVATRVFKADGSTQIKVTGVDGRAVNGTEALGKLFSQIALDPLAFARLSDAEQVATLLPMIGFDPAPLDKEQKDAFELRTIEGRTQKALQNRLAAEPDPDPSLPAEWVSVSALSRELELALAANAEGARLELAKAEASARIDDATNDLYAARARVKEAEAAVEAALTRAQAAEDYAGELVRMLEERPPAIETDPIREKIASAEATNAKIRAQEARAQIAEELAAVTERHDELTARIDAAKAAKADALAKAKLPLPGLSIDPESMTLMMDGTPFSEASTGKKIKIGTAIAMALSPDLRLIVIRDASLLDQKNLAVIDELAKANDYLVLLEIADDRNGTGALIVEGRVAEVRS